ncbi:MAG: CHASE domain-containing protein [Rubrivivax sp.]|nr:CHASE domain-containing protein [Rubrivivax sp.]
MAAESSHSPERKAQPHPLGLLLAFALAYAALSWLSLQLPLAAAVASPIYPPAGLALAAALVYGRTGAIGCGLGALLANTLFVASAEAFKTPTELIRPVVTGIGAALQAAVGAWLLRRAIGESMALGTLKEILQAGWWGGFVACLINASLSVGTLWLQGQVDGAAAWFTWWTWWVGDTLGVLIGAPVVLAFMGRPRAAWRPRRLSVALPMGAATLLLALAFYLFQQAEVQRQEMAFRAAADSAARTAQSLLDDATDALQALHQSLDPLERPGAEALLAASAWWLQRNPSLLAMGLGERVRRDQIASFEAEVRADGQPGFRVHERADGLVLAREDEFVIAIRAIAPAAGNEAALGVNILSAPAARDALQQARGPTGTVATRAFRPSQSGPDVRSGSVVYQWLSGPGSATGEAASAPVARGVVFVTVVLDRVVARAVERGAMSALRWCLREAVPGGSAQVVGDGQGCADQPGTFQQRATLRLAQRQWELQLSAGPQAGEAPLATNAWLLSVLGMAATTLLGLLLLTVTGHTRRVESAVRDRTQALSVEIRERRGAEQALRESEQRLRSILDHLPLGVVFLDVQGRVLELNPVMAQLLGRAPEALRELSFPELLRDDEAQPVRQRWRAVVEGEQALTQDLLHLRRHDGSEVTVRATITALRQGGDHPTRLVGLVEDITEHLRVIEIERARDAAEAANKAKTEFVSRMSHELRTPLNAMLGFSQLMAMDQRQPLSSHQAGWNSQIQRAGWHLLELINETLDLSRIEAGAVQLLADAVDLRAVVEAAIALLTPASQARGLSLSLIEPGTARLTALGDETRIKQILTNLLSNAIKYNRDGGRIEVRIAEAGPSQLAIEVRDTGLGMSAQQLGALFQPYNRLGRERTTIEGTGIGLVISRKLAELMGGRLEAVSTEGLGSTFTVTLPAAVGGAQPLPSADTQPGRHAGAQHLVHYIEDNETNVLLMQGMVAARPLLALTVSTLGLDGLLEVRRALPDLVLLDMHLPDIDGLELLRRLKADDTTAGIPVVVVSADATPARVEEALTLGAVRYVTKPVDMATLLRTLDEVLAEQDSRWM